MHIFPRKGHVPWPHHSFGTVKNEVLNVKFSENSKILKNKKVCIQNNNVLIE